MQTNDFQKPNAQSSETPKDPKQEIEKDSEQENIQNQKEEPKSLIRKIDERVKTKVIKYIFI